MQRVKIEHSSQSDNNTSHSLSSHQPYQPNPHPRIQRLNASPLPQTLSHHSPHSSSFFAPPPPPIPPPAPPFFIALVPMPLGFFPAIPPPALASPALPNSSQKSCLSFAGPVGAAPKLSQKSLRSGSRCPDKGAREEEEEGCAESPSTKRENCVFAFATPDWRVWPRVPAVVRAWVARSASASCSMMC